MNNLIDFYPSFSFLLVLPMFFAIIYYGVSEAENAKEYLLIVSLVTYVFFILALYNSYITIESLSK